jgi:hypothetical protein
VSRVDVAVQVPRLARVHRCPGGPGVAGGTGVAGGHQTAPGGLAALTISGA